MDGEQDAVGAGLRLEQPEDGGEALLVGVLVGGLAQDELQRAAAAMLRKGRALSAIDGSLEGGASKDGASSIGGGRS